MANTVPVARVSALQGQAYAKDKAGNLRPLQVGDPIYEGDVVLAAEGSRVELASDDGRSLVFAEVRLRKNGRFGGAAASITASKQQRVILAAQHWLAGDGRRHANRACRFDAILLDGLDAARIEWIRGAFDAS